jgi:hypothetical protein
MSAVSPLESAQVLVHEGKGKSGGWDGEPGTAKSSGRAPLPRAHPCPCPAADTPPENRENRENRLWVRMWTAEGLAVRRGSVAKEVSLRGCSAVLERP